MNLSSIISKVGNPGQRAKQALRTTSASKRLANLAVQQQGIDDEQDRLEAGPKNMLGSPIGSSFSMRDYTDNLNRQGEIARLTNELAGGDGNVVRYGGTHPSATSSLQTRAMGSVAGPVGGGGDDDLHRHRMQQFDVQDRLDKRLAGAIADMKRSEQDPDFDLHSGRAAARVGAVGDIRRSEELLDATNRGTAKANEYLAPRADAMRQQERWDAVEKSRDLAPFNKDIIGANSRLGVADINAGARLGSAQIGADARIGSSAISSLGRMAGTPTFTPDDAARVQGGIDAVQPLVPGQGGPAPTKTFPRASLPQLMQTYGIQSEADAEAFLRHWGYAVQ